MSERLALFKFPLAAAILGLAAAGVYGGAGALGTVAILLALETTVSFDNAVVNAGVLRRLSERWRRAFLTIGVIIAVFGMRIVFPIAIVSAATGHSFAAVVNQALHEQEAYARDVESAAPLIGAFGGTFLLLLALDFLLERNRGRQWIVPVERQLTKLGRLTYAPVIIAAAALLATALFVSPEQQRATLVAGLMGLVAFLSVNAFRQLMQQRRDTGQRAGAAGLAGFVYLETLDASFSLDGVLGAFALSSDIVLVAIGLGVGALFVRSLTLHLVREGTLRELPFLTHGAHWAIGALGVFLLLGIEHHPPEWLTGGVSVALLAAAWVTSLAAKNHAAPSRSDAG